MADQKEVKCTRKVLGEIVSGLREHDAKLPLPWENISTETDSTKKSQPKALGYRLSPTAMILLVAQPVLAAGLQRALRSLDRRSN